MKTLFTALAILASLSGCASLTPYEEIVRSLPEDRLIEIDGQRIHVETHGSGPTLLLLHGFASSTYSFRKITPALAKNHRVVAIDLNGFGYTERPSEPEEYRAPRQVETIQALLDRLGIRKCSVIAHSYGGALAILLADTEPERIEKLVLISPYTEFEESPPILQSSAGRGMAYVGLRALLSSRTIAQASVRRAFHQDRLVTRKVAEEYRRRILVEGFRDAFEGYSLAMEDSGPIELPLAEIGQPALVIAGRHDQLVGVDSCRRTAATIPNATMHVLEKSGHSSAEEQPEELVRLITEFLKKQHDITG